MKFCSDTIYELPCSGCCFSVIYYDRWGTDPQDTSIHSYDVAITGIFHSEGTKCDSCSKQILVDYSYKKLITMNSLDTNFYKLLKGDSIRLITAAEYLYTKGRCLNSQGNDCDNVERCCQSTYEINFDSLHKLSSVIPQYDQIFPLCPPTCQPVCKQPQLNPYSDTNFCVDKCNNGQWYSNSSDSLTFPGCPGCKYKIFYRTRTPDCIPSFTDITIDSIKHNTKCDSCYFGLVQQLYWSSVKWIIKHAALGHIDLLHPCDTNYRVLSLSCWANDFYRGKCGPCVWTACCWARYEVCLVNNIPVVTRLESSTQTDSCNGAAFPCIYICDDMTDTLPKIDVNYEDNVNNDYSSYVIPNPSAGKIDIHFISPSNLKIQLKIYDLTGNEINSFEKLKNQGETVFTVDISSVPNGIYHYNILEQEKIINSGSISIIH